MGFRDPKLEDRQRAAMDAKKALLDKFKSQPGPGHPEYEARKKEREAVLAARADREAAKLAELQEQERLAEIERQEAARRLQEELDRKDRERTEREEREKEEEALKKAERDAKYAARKARAKKTSKCNVPGRLVGDPGARGCGGLSGLARIFFALAVMAGRSPPTAYVVPHPR